jgi:RNA polymerase sigma factor (sigma-70 family)
MTDADLLRKFVTGGDQEAFGVIVRRHVDMVYASAARQLADHALAEDVTQAVFIVLARKAARVNGQMLPGWLVKAARFLALEARCGELRRRAREREVAAMNGESDQTDQWQRLGAVLDEALSHLGDRDRTAVTLRYLEGREPREVAAALGVSEAAASKRLSRAIAKLRKRFSRQGVEVPAASIGITLLTHAQLSCPAGLAGKTVAAAIGSSAAAAATGAGAATAASATGGASALAHAALASSAFGGITAWGYATVAAAALLTAAGTGAVRHVINSHKVVAPVVAVMPALQTGPVRVGVIVSKFTAVGPHLTRSPYGSGHLPMVRALRTDPMLQLIPVVEPGTETDPDIAGILKTTFRHMDPINGGDVNQLMTLDVIACPRVWDETPEVMSAVEGAVRQGKGLLILAGFAMTSPGPSPQVDRINGLKNGRYEATQEEVDCEVIADHPLLGKLSRGDVVSIDPNGECGVLPAGAVPLIRVKDPAIAFANGVFLPTTVPANQQNYPFYPLFISQLGQGTIVNCAFHAWNPVPSDLDNATNGQFLIRCVKWLAHRPLQ